MKIAFIVIGAIVLLFGLFLAVILLRNRINCPVPVKAKISRLGKKKTTWRGATVTQYRPTYSYKLDGQTYTFESPVTTMNPKKYTLGMEVNIRVSKKDPSNIDMNTLGSAIASILFTVCGVALLVVCIVVL